MLDRFTHWPEDTIAIQYHEGPGMTVGKHDVIFASSLLRDKKVIIVVLPHAGKQFNQTISHPY